MRDNCTVCHAVLPQIQDLLKDYPAQLGVINQSNVEEIAGELSIFTVPVDLIFFLKGKKCIDKHVLSICNRLKTNCI